MPYKTIQEEHGVLTKWWGDASTSELIHMQEKVHAMPDFDIFFYSIHDFSQCDHFASKQNEVEYASALDAAAFLTNPKFKIAIVGANPEVLEAVNSFIILGLSPYPLRTFSLMDEARAWVM